MHESTGEIVELMNLLVVFGTRPEAIKLAPLILKLRQQFKVKICVTGQHREMLDQVLRIFQIKSDFEFEFDFSFDVDVQNYAIFGSFSGRCHPFRTVFGWF